MLRLLPTPTTTPFTFWYLVVLLLTSLLVRYGPATAVDRLIAMSSTDAANLAQHPVRVLFLSALWLADQHWLIYVGIFTAVIAPLERRIGAKWTMLVFVSGHVLATLATELPVLWGIRAALLPHADAYLIDVGVSYGLFATAGALLMMLPTRARWSAIVAVHLSILVIYLGMGPADTDSVVTALGHLVAAYVGMLSWLPWLRRRKLIGSWRPEETVTAAPAAVT